MRMPGGGAQFNQTDPNIVPSSAMQRIDVLADGASAVYGSDAVAGVVNFVTRRTYDGLQINTQFANADSYDTWDLNGIWGTSWETGGVYVAAQYSSASQLWVKDRDWASRGDYRDVGGSNTNGFTCEPATIRVTGVSSGTAPGGGLIFVSPGDTTPVPNNAATNGVCNLSVYNSFIPSQYRANGVIRVVNDFSDALSLSASLLYNRNQTHADQGPGQLNNATAFGVGADVAGQQNPFFTAPAGAPAATTELINWLAMREDEKYGHIESQQDVVYANVVLDYQISDKWSMTVADSIGWNRSVARRLQAVLRGLRDAGAERNHAVQWQHDGLEHPGPERGGAAASADDQQRARRLECGSGEPHRSAGAGQSLYEQHAEQQLQHVQSVPRGGAGRIVRHARGSFPIAVGGEHMWQDQQFKLSGGNNTGPTTTGSGYRVFNFERDIMSAFAEVPFRWFRPNGTFRRSTSSI